MPYRIYLCGNDQRLRDDSEVCADHANHTPSPDGYIEWHHWAKEMSKTHRQVKCPTCGLYAIWVPKEQRVLAEGS